MIGVLIISCLLLIGLVGGGGYLIYSTLHTDDDSSSSSNQVDTIGPLSTTNTAQLCSTKPTGDDTNLRGEAIYPIPDYIVANMLNNGTWHEGCPVPIEDLVLLNLPYWNCDEGVTKTGEMIVHRNVSDQVLVIFDQLFLTGFPIYKMNLMYKYGANDSLAMADNNTSCFCCREKTNQPNTFSLHSYGIAIDVNTYINPYVNGDIILPEEGAMYANRSIVVSIFFSSIFFLNFFIKIYHFVIDSWYDCRKWRSLL